MSQSLSEISLRYSIGLIAKIIEVETKELPVIELQKDDIFRLAEESPSNDWERLSALVVDQVKLLHDSETKNVRTKTVYEDVDLSYFLDEMNRLF